VPGQRRVLIGLLADTHVREVLPELPAEVLRRLSGCDLIIHAGDLSDMQVVRQLEQIAPVVAVQGDHDRDADVPLPESRVVEVAGHRIGVVHGRRRRALEVLAAGVSVVRGRPTTLGLGAALLRRVGPVDALVFGHLHIAHISRRRGTLLVNPGGVYTLASDRAHRPTGLRARAFGRAVGRLPASATTSSIAFMHAASDEPLHAWIEPLREPIRPVRR
jgi:putative phosphoesterase